MNYLENCELALRLWRERVTPSMVVEDLAYWVDAQCGGAACFGGWLATWPEFREMGVRQRGDPEANPGYGDYDHPGYYLSPGEVCLPVAGWWDGRKVGRVLFGADLFKPRGMDEPEETSDYQLVIDRLQQRISELKCLNSGTAC